MERDCTRSSSVSTQADVDDGGLFARQIQIFAFAWISIGGSAGERHQGDGRKREGDGKKSKKWISYLQTAILVLVFGTSSSSTTYLFTRSAVLMDTRKLGEELLPSSLLCQGPSLMGHLEFLPQNCLWCRKFHSENP